MNLKGLRDRLDCSSKVVKDTFGDERIYGKEANISIDAEHLSNRVWYLDFGEGTREWYNLKAKLKFMHTTPIFDIQHILFLDRYPTKEEAVKIRKIGGFGVRRHQTEKQKVAALKNLIPLRG